MIESTNSMHYFHYSIFRSKMLSSFLHIVYIRVLTHNYENLSIFLFLLEIDLLLDMFYCAYLCAKASAYLGNLLLLYVRF